MADILIVTDRADDLRELVNVLERAGHQVTVAFFDAITTPDPSPSVVIVDAVKDLARGRDACRAARASSSAIRIIPYLASESLGAVGHDWQADTFLVEGVRREELLARLRLALGPPAETPPAAILVGDLSIDPDTYQVRLRGRPLDLTYKEFQLLQFLAQRPGRVFSRGVLLQEVWGYDFFGGTRTVDVHVRRLRAKLGAEHESMIATVRNVGYKIEAPPRSRA